MGTKIPFRLQTIWTNQWVKRYRINQLTDTHMENDRTLSMHCECMYDYIYIRYDFIIVLL